RLNERLQTESTAPFSSYLDPKGSLLALTDMSNIEVWLTK
ncbi:MAG: CppA C-terminal domain-containing protein, partial [Streptococcus thermophilus]